MWLNFPCFVQNPRNAQSHLSTLALYWLIVCSVGFCMEHGKSECNWNPLYSCIIVQDCMAITMLDHTVIGQLYHGDDDISSAFTVHEINLYSSLQVNNNSPDLSVPSLHKPSPSLETSNWLPQTGLMLILGALVQSGTMKLLTPSC